MAKKKIMDLAAIQSFAEGGNVESKPSPKKKEKEAPEAPEKSVQKQVNLRLWSDQLDLIDKILQARPRTISRNAWLLEAVEEKLEKEKKKYKF